MLNTVKYSSLHVTRPLHENEKKASVFAIYAYYVKGVPLYNGRYIKGAPFSAREMTSKEQLQKFHTDDVSLTRTR